jgi:hypothetical protein
MPDGIIAKHIAMFASVLYIDGILIQICSVLSFNTQNTLPELHRERLNNRDYL